MVSYVLILSGVARKLPEPTRFMHHSEAVTVEAEVRTFGSAEPMATSRGAMKIWTMILGILAT